MIDSLDIALEGHEGAFVGAGLDDGALIFMKMMMSKRNSWNCGQRYLETRKRCFVVRVSQFI